jgi:hypothetical protein
MQPRMAGGEPAFALLPQRQHEVAARSEEHVPVAGVRRLAEYLKVEHVQIERQRSVQVRHVEARMASLHALGDRSSLHDPSLRPGT